MKSIIKKVFRVGKPVTALEIWAYIGVIFALFFLFYHVISFYNVI